MRCATAGEADPARKADLIQRSADLEANWIENGAARVALHTLVGGLGGGAGGALGAGATALATPTIVAQIAKLDLPDEVKSALTVAAGAAVGAVAGGKAGAGAAVNEVTNNFLKHKEAAAFKSKLDGCEARKGGCPEDERQAIRNEYLGISAKNIAELELCRTRADQSCLAQIKKDIAATSELPKSLAGPDTTIFQGRQNSADRTVNQALIDIKSLAAGRAKLCGNLGTADCDNKIRRAKGDATVRATGLVLSVVGGGVLTSETVAGVAISSTVQAAEAIGAGARLLVVSGKLAVAELSSMATMGLMDYCTVKSQVCLAAADAIAGVVSGAPVTGVPLPGNIGGKAAGAAANDAKVGAGLAAEVKAAGAESGTIVMTKAEATAKNLAPCCYAPGTQVATPAGYKAIETLKQDDMVWTRRDDNSGDVFAATPCTDRR